MPRTYVRKKEKNYAVGDLKSALKMVRTNEASAVVAAAQFRIPISTLYAHLSGRISEPQAGGKTILSHEEEEFLVHVVRLYQDWQQPLTRENLISIARTFMIELAKKGVTTKSRLREWCFGFERRWRDELKIVQPYKLEKVRSIACTQLVVDRWFQHLHGVMSDLELFDRPEAIYNVDESGFGDDPGRKMVIVRRESKHAICAQGGSGKSYTTLIICASASGKFLPPYIIYRAKKLFDSWMPKNCYPGTRFNATPSGWSEEATFFDWLTKQFIPSVKDVQKPVLLVMDGHHSHLSTRIIKCSIENGIHIECLPPHTTTILQPLDVVTLAKLKTTWRKILWEHYRETNAEPISKTKFALLIADLFKNHFLPSHCVGGFGKAGIYPFDKRAVSKEKLLQTHSADLDSSISPSDTLTAIADSTLMDTTTDESPRTSLCPNNSTTTSSDHGPSVNIDLNTFAPTVPLQTASIDMNPSIIPPVNVTTSPATLTPVPNVNVDSTPPSLVPTTTFDSIQPTSATSILSDTLRLIYDEIDQPMFTDLTVRPISESFDNTPMDVQLSIPPGTSHPSVSHHEQTVSFGSSQVLSSSTQTAETTPGTRSPLDAITVAIANQVKAATPKTTQKKRQIDRPYGESITTTEAYEKLLAKETTRKRRATKKQDEAADGEKPKAARGRPRKKPVSSTEKENAPIDNLTHVAPVQMNTHPQSSYVQYSQNTPYQNPGFYQNVANSTNTFVPSHSYNQSILYQQPTNYFTNYLLCYKCNDPLYSNISRYSLCTSCGRPCCMSCIHTQPFANVYGYRCEYCSIDVALQTTAGISTNVQPL